MNKSRIANPSIDEPFPLKHRFRRRFVPALAGFVGLSLIIIGLTARSAVEAIYLELAQRRAQTIEREVAEASPIAWARLMDGEPFAALQGSDAATNLVDAFSAAVRQQNLMELKVYDLSSRVQFATNADEIGTTENGDALRQVIAEGDSGLVLKPLPDGSKQYELYVPVFDDQNALRVVFELYEPVSYLNSILLRAAIPIIVIPGLLFLVLGVTLDRLVNSAQLDIDMRSRLIRELQRRLESFVSATAVDAARNSSGAEAIPSKRIVTVLFFSDVRDFTGFSEQNSPEDVVAFLNDIMSLQVEILKKNQGDVDKMIGDAVLARFDGPNGAEQAIAAAKEIQAALRDSRLPRSIGIGVFRGDVISGTIGPENRRDFTVIGDAVNVAARLCSEAKSGEIVTAADLADDTFGPMELVSVKGRERPVSIRRYRTEG